MRQTPVPLTTGMVIALMMLLRLIVHQLAYHLFPMGDKGHYQLFSYFNDVVAAFAKEWSNNSEQEQRDFYNNYRLED